MTVTNLTALCFTMGRQGGTIHQVADDLGVESAFILNANEDAMGDLLRIAQEYRNKTHRFKPVSFRLPSKIYAWSGFEGCEGSWSFEPCGCGNHPEMEGFVRADIHDEALTALKVALDAINMTLSANAALEEANIIICTGTETTRKLERAKAMAEEVLK